MSIDYQRLSPLLLFLTSMCGLFAIAVLVASAFVGSASAQSEPISMRMFSSKAPGATIPERVTRQEKAVTLNEEGVELVFHGDQQKGIAKIKEALAHDPNNTTILYNLAGLYLANSEPAKALGIMKRALEIDPNDTSFLYRRAESALLSNDVSDASDAFARLAEIHPEDGEVLLKLGTLYAMQKKWEQSEATFHKANTQLENDKRVLGNLANVYVVQGKYAEAIPLLKKVQELEPSASNDIALAMAYEGLGKLPEALSHYREAKEHGEGGEDLDQHISKLERRVAEEVSQ